MTITPATLHTLEHAVLSAADGILARLSNPSQITSWLKKDNSLVMDLDLESHRLITKALDDGRAVVSEEEVSSHALLSQSDDLWLVDPLDGTSTCKRFMSLRGGQVGYGPLVGSLKSGRIEACSFYHVPRRALYTAVRGGGAWWVMHELDGKPLPDLKSRSRLLVSASPALKDCVALFYPGSLGELSLVEHLAKNRLVDQLHNFGGFANDCVRLAHGFEQIQFQYSVGPWDYSVLLLAVEAGLTVLVDPLGSRTKFQEWAVRSNNPVLVYPPELEDALMRVLDQAISKGFEVVS